MADQALQDVLARALISFRPLTADYFGEVLDHIYEALRDAKTSAATGPELDDGLNRQKAFLLCQAIISAGLGAPEGIDLCWDGTAWGLTRPDGTPLPNREAERAILYGFSDFACRCFVFSVGLKLTEIGQFTGPEIDHVQHLLTDALNAARGQTTIGLLFSAAKSLSGSPERLDHEWEIGGASLGFYVLAGTYFLTNAYCLRPNQVRGSLDAILTDNSKRMFEDFNDFRLWLFYSAAIAPVYKALEFWATNLLQTWSQFEPDIGRKLLLNTSLAIAFFGKLDLVVAAMLRGLSAGDKFLTAIENSFSALAQRLQSEFAAQQFNAARQRNHSRKS